MTPRGAANPARRPRAIAVVIAVVNVAAPRGVCHTFPMRQIGRSNVALPAALPSAAALRAAAIHQATGVGLAALSTTGIVKGIYRFATHGEMNRHTDEALVRAMAMNIARRGQQP